jgi:hypothetical protein
MPIVASVALARGRVRPATSGRLPTSGITVGIVLLGVIALVGGLTFLPGPGLGFPCRGAVGGLAAAVANAPNSLSSSTARTR